MPKPSPTPGPPDQAPVTGLRRPPIPHAQLHDELPNAGSSRAHQGPG